MKTITLIMAIFLSGFVNSAGLVHPTVTKIDISGVIGEKGTLKSIPFHLVADYKDKATVWPANNQQLNKLAVSLNGISMSISDELYNKLTGVVLSEIHLSYIQQWSDKSSVEVVIPYGELKTCESPDDGTVHHLKQKMILVFSVSGFYRESKNIQPCEH
jgi:hypothetical protein